jgi:hypothetical protein
LRAVEQQSKQIDAMERERERLQREANVPPPEAPQPPVQPTETTESVTPHSGGEITSAVPGTGSAPPLPPAIDVRPAPRPRAVLPAAPPVRAAAPKNSAPPPSPLNPPLDLLGAQH